MIAGKSSETASAASGAAFGERRWFWFLALVCSVVLFSHFGSAALFEPDEGRNAEKAREILLLNDWITPHQNFLPTLDKPMAHYWLVASSFKLFGMSEGPARLPSVLAALGCVFLVYRFALRQWGLWPALWSALVLTSSLQFYVFSRIVIFDMTLTFSIVSALCCFYRAVQEENPRSARFHALLMYASMGAGTLIKGPIAAVVPGMVIFCYLLLTRRWRFLRKTNVLLGLLVYCAVVAPWYVLAEIKNPGYLRYFLWEEHLARYLTPRFSRTGAWYYFFPVLAVGFVPWSFLFPLAMRDLWKRTFSDGRLFMILWLVLPFIFFSASSSKLPHYILPVYPALALLTGHAIAAHLGDASARRWPLYLLWGLILGFILYLLVGSVWPHLLPHQVRDAVIQKMALVAVHGVTISLVFGAWLIGDLRCAWKDQAASFLCAAVGLALFFVLVGQIMAATSFHRLSKPLAEAAAPLIDPGDRIVFYNTYVEGLPFYLRIDRPIWVVQASNRGSPMGSNYVADRRPTPPPGYGQVLLTFEEFAERRQEKNAPPFKIFVREKNFAKLLRELKIAPKILLRFDDYYLLTNR